MPARSPARAPLQAHGIRLTRQRELLFEIINNAHRHLNADQLFELAKKRDPKINRVTIYRTLKANGEDGGLHTTLKALGQRFDRPSQKAKRSSGEVPGE